MKLLPGSALLLCCAAALTACGDDVSGPGPVHAPSGLIAEQVSFTTIRVSWRGVPGVTYLLQRASATAPGTFVQLGGHLLNASVFDDHDVAASVGYSYRVAAVRTDTSDFSTTAIFSTAIVCPAPASPQSVLVDASHDGGVWWYPQVAPFFPDAIHQGQALADTLRAKGYVVDEVARGDTIDRDRLLQYAVVIRAGQFGPYVPSELFAYDDFVECPRTLLLLGEFLRPGEHDQLAAQLGIPFDSIAGGSVTTFASHAITAGVGAFPYGVGSVITGDVPASVHVLGWLASGEAVMGVLDGHPAKVFWIGDTNTLEWLPQPLVNNLVAWGF